jgi:hypothetical protein
MKPRLKKYAFYVTIVKGIVAARRGRPCGLDVLADAQLPLQKLLDLSPAIDLFSNSRVTTR